MGWRIVPPALYESDGFVVSIFRCKLSPAVNKAGLKLTLVRPGAPQNIVKMTEVQHLHDSLQQQGKGRPASQQCRCCAQQAGIRRAT